MTYRTGSIGSFMQWTKRVIAEPGIAEATSKHWFETDATAAKALDPKASPEAMVKLLSAENLALLHLIQAHRPGSLRELAILANRKESNLSRTLKKLYDAGIVDFKEGAGRARAPHVTARRVILELDLAGPDSVVTVDRLKAN